MSTELTQEEFIARCIKQHGKAYNYSKVQYHHKNDKIMVICPIHGEFIVTAYDHIHGKGCPECAKIISGNKIRGNYENFISNAHAKFGKKYVFPHIADEYINNKSFITIKCNNCGRILKKRAIDFLKSAYGGCYCTKISMINFEEAKKLCVGYEIIEFKGKLNTRESHITLKCPIHGNFKVKISNLMRGEYKCPKCCMIERIKQQNADDICDKISKMAHYSVIPNKLTFKGMDEKMEFRCCVCGQTFHRKPSVYFTTNLRYKCPICNKNHTSDEVYNKKACTYNSKCAKEASSKQENEINSYINSIGYETIRNDRKLLGGQELDIYIPSSNVAFEVNGLYWHSEIRKDNFYHLNKTKKCKLVGVNLIHIFEDEWNSKQDILKSMINHILHGFETRIHARKCDIGIVSNSDAFKFFDKNHILGKCGGGLNIGLFYGKELVFVMSFKKNGDKSYEIVRFCSKLFTRVDGGISKVIRYFAKSNLVDHLSCKVDLRFGDGSALKSIGFYDEKIEQPDYYYVSNCERHKKHKFKKSILVEKYGCPQNMTEHEFCLSKKWFRIYDCGKKIMMLDIKRH